MTAHSLPVRPQVLFVSADLPWPPDGGGRIATLRNLEAFSSFCDVDVVALADLTESPDLTELRRICRSVWVVDHPFTFGRHRVRQSLTALLSVASRWPYRLRKFRSLELERVLDGMLSTGRYDLVHFDQFGVVPYNRSSLPSTYACQNVESNVYSLAASGARGRLARLWSRLEAAKLRRAEQRFLGTFDEVFVLAPEDVALLGDIGITRTRLTPMPAPTVRDPVSWPPESRVITTLGTMSWFGVEDGLLWFRNEIYPRIRQQVPDASWQLIGPNASRALQDLDGTDGIRVRGYLPDIGPALAATRAAVVPLQIAGGIRMKLLDLMAAGVPSVATSLGARGLSFADGVGCFRRDDPASFAEAVTRLLTDNDLWVRTVSSGRTYLGVHHTAAIHAAAVRESVATIVARRGGPGPR